MGGNRDLVLSSSMVMRSEENKEGIIGKKEEEIAVEEENQEGRIGVEVEEENQEGRIGEEEEENQQGRIGKEEEENHQGRIGEEEENHQGTIGEEEENQEGRIGQEEEENQQEGRIGQEEEEEEEERRPLDHYVPLLEDGISLFGERRRVLTYMDHVSRGGESSTSDFEAWDEEMAAQLFQEQEGMSSPIRGGTDVWSEDGEDWSEDDEEEEEEEGEIVVFTPVNRQFQIAKSVVESLPIVVPTKDYVQDEEEYIVDCCSICTDEFLPEEKARKLPCCHCYHEECILRWLGRRRTCPVCRYKMSSRSNGDENLGRG